MIRSPRTGKRDRGLADHDSPRDPRRLVEREPHREEAAERVADQRDLVEAAAIEQLGEDGDSLLADRSALPTVGWRQRVAREIDEHVAAPW